MIEKGGSVVTQLGALSAEDEVAIVMSTGRAEAKIKKIEKILSETAMSLK
jgi:hypothetical protein